jgi:hypothetical protein
MASDRGTIPRGAGTDQQWAEPTAPTGRRMPSTPRERKPLLAFLAALLVVVGGLSAALLVQKAGHKVQAVEVMQALGPGEQVPASALSEVDIASGSGIDYVPWAAVPQVERDFAKFQIPAGTLLTGNMLVATYNLNKGDAQEGIFLKAGQVPPNLQIGDRIATFATGPTTPCGGTPDEPLGTGTVTGVLGEASNSTATTVVTIAVPQTSPTYGLLACEAANNTIAIVIIPSGGGNG